MIRAKELGGRAVVDVDAAEKLGKIDRVVLDPDRRRVAGFVVGRGSSLFSNDKDLMLPASCVHAIGPDAMTVHRGGDFETDLGLDGLPRVSDIAGRKVVSDEGRLMGTVDDVLIDETDGRILGYALDDAGVLDKPRNPADADSKQPRGAYLRADANLRAGKDLIVAPEDAISYDWDTLGTPQALAADAPRRWTSPAPATGLPDTQWIRTEGN
ncbi:MAG: PRC-barrel domain-containing protein [Acidobacteriota bacterium]|nr:PRC-barrel domain-containing protein [Acidobacteriota bacterium]